MKIANFIGDYLAFIAAENCNDYLQVADVPEELTWFQHAVENPPSLQHQSRLLIRKVLRKDLKNKVQALPLPNRIKNYILLHDVLKVDK